MQKFLKDWRNSALIVAAILIVILIIFIKTGGERTNSTLVRVGTKNITVSDLNAIMKKRFGEQMVKQTVSDMLIQTYAEMKNVSANEREIDQLVNQEKRVAEQQGKSLDDDLKASGLTMEAFREQARSMALRAKLVVPGEEIAKVLQEIVKSNDPSLTYPQSYRIRTLYYSNEEFAKQSLAMLQGVKDDEAGKIQLAQVAGSALNASTAMNINRYTIEGDKDTLDVELIAALKDLQPNMWSEPTKMHISSKKPPKDEKEAEAMKSYRRIIQLIEVVPEEKPTLENRNIIIAMDIIQQKQDYYQKFNQIEAEARQKIDVTFLNNDFPIAVKFFNDLYKQNQPIPGADSFGGSAMNVTPGPLPAPDAIPTPPGAGK